ncbi:hypothetical protein PpBr36_02943 [Pyricularia pennisetigena]|uniref:hypothetical protein n=1 Tax=Pyricularia pennisetigena TaxID=1578925 RepID=UPI0011515529|nr:hypothetical protein PpBr36_02943 [Pyricularia pennisetigena]TLS30372.1 hypothetical protein PpBr36_02943 [Pyricularia pennisetigena]
MLKEARSVRGGEVQCTQGFLTKEGVGGGGPASPERAHSLIDAACPARILAYPGPPRLEEAPWSGPFVTDLGIRYQNRKWMVDGWIEGCLRQSFATYQIGDGSNAETGQGRK